MLTKLVQRYTNEANLREEEQAYRMTENGGDDDDNG